MKRSLSEIIAQMRGYMFRFLSIGVGLLDNNMEWLHRMTYRPKPTLILAIVLYFSSSFFKKSFEFSKCMYIFLIFVYLNHCTKVVKLRILLNTLIFL